MSATRSTSGCNVAAETSNHLRVGEPAATRRAALRSGIPTGFRPRAQGLRGTSYLGVIVRQTSPTATRLRPIRSRPRAPDLSHNAVGVDSISERAPKVGVARQPWAGGPNPFGIVRSAGLRRLRPAALRMVQECCGSETRAPVGVSDAPCATFKDCCCPPVRSNATRKG